MSVECLLFKAFNLKSSWHLLNYRCPSWWPSLIIVVNLSQEKALTYQLTPHSSARMLCWIDPHKVAPLSSWGLWIPCVDFMPFLPNVRCEHIGGGRKKWMTKPPTLSILTPLFPLSKHKCHFIEKTAIYIFLHKKNGQVIVLLYCHLPRWTTLSLANGKLNC